MNYRVKGDLTPIVFRLLDVNGDPVTGLSPTATLSKNGAAYAAAAGTVAELGGGDYKLTPASADVSTDGDLRCLFAASGSTGAFQSFLIIEPTGVLPIGYSDRAYTPVPDLPADPNADDVTLGTGK